jgi:hypothetical protein
VRRPAPRPSPRATATVDAVAIVAFVVVGVVQHGGLAWNGIARTGIPLLAAWFLVSLALGTYRRIGWVTMLITWALAMPIGLLARSVIRGGPWGRGLLEFGGIAMAFTLLFLVGGRLLLLAAAVARGRRAPGEASEAA